VTAQTRRTNQAPGFGDITFVPFDQQLFLVGAAADTDALARQRLPVGVGPVVVLRHLQRDIAEPVGGEVVLLLALLGHGDTGDERVHLTGIDLHEILRPVGSEGFEAQPEDIGDQIGEIDLGADQCPVVGGMEPQRRSGGGRTRDHEGAPIPDGLRHFRGDGVDLVGAHPRRLLGREVEDLSVGGADLVADLAAAAAGGRHQRHGGQDRGQYSAPPVGSGRTHGVFPEFVDVWG
jgi:hypothetical protein